MEPAACGTLRRAGYTALQLLNVLAVYLPFAVGALVMLLKAVPQLGAILDPSTLAVTSSAFYLDALVTSLVLFFGSLVVGLLFLVTVPRVLNLAIMMFDCHPERSIVVNDIHKPQGYSPSRYSSHRRCIPIRLALNV